jgi:cardiolipin synthase A/B
MEGDSVAQVQRSFLASYRFLGGPLPEKPAELARYFPAYEGPRDGVKTQLVASVPGEAMRVTDAYHREIDGATRSLDVMNPYFGDDTIVDKLCAAARRGVQVRVVVNRDAENAFSTAAQRHEFGKLAAAGVQVYEYPHTLHAKVLVKDGERVLVGSTNLDGLSLKRNFELNLLLDDKAKAAEFQKRLFDPDVAASTLAKPETSPLKRVWNALVDKLDHFW